MKPNVSGTQILLTTWFFMYPSPPRVVRCGFLTNPPSPPVRPRGLRMAPYRVWTTCHRPQTVKSNQPL